MSDERASAGNFNRYAQYQTKTETADELGQPTETWATAYNLWISVRSPNGRESLEASQKTASVNRMVEHHYVSGIENDAKGRYVMDDGSILNVAWAVDPDARKVIIRAYCLQQVVPTP